MSQLKIYRCLSFSPFNFIRILIFGFITSFVVLFIVSRSVNIALLTSVIFILLIEIIYIASSFTTVSINGQNLEIKNFGSKLKLKNLQSVQTWWTYDFGISTPELGESGVGKSNPSANKINCFVEFSSPTNSIYIYEEIHLGEKFPNNHQYKPNESIDRSNLIKVWDIDKCLEKIEISPTRSASN